MFLVRLVVVGAIIVIVPLVALLLLIVLSISTPAFNPVVWISITDDITQVTAMSVTPSTVLLWWSDVAGRVPTRTLSVVILVTPIPLLLVADWIYYGCCVQHRLEALDVHIDFFVILGKVRVIWSTSILEAKALWVSVW
jgi:hypothetical protein